MLSMLTPYLHYLNMIRGDRDGGADDMVESTLIFFMTICLLPVCLLKDWSLLIAVCLPFFSSCIPAVVKGQQLTLPAWSPCDSEEVDSLAKGILHDATPALGTSRFIEVRAGWIFHLCPWPCCFIGSPGSHLYKVFPFLFFLDFFIPSSPGLWLCVLQCCVPFFAVFFSSWPCQSPIYLILLYELPQASLLLWCCWRGSILQGIWVSFYGLAPFHTHQTTRVKSARSARSEFWACSNCSFVLDQSFPPVCSSSSKLIWLSSCPLLLVVFVLLPCFAEFIPFLLVEACPPRIVSRFDVSLVWLQTNRLTVSQCLCTADYHYYCLFVFRLQRIIELSASFFRIVLVLCLSSFLSTDGSLPRKECV